MNTEWINRATVNESSLNISKVNYTGLMSGKARGENPPGPEPEPEPAPRPQPQRPRPQVPRFTQGFSTASVQPQPVAAPREDSDEGSQGGDAPQIINVPAFIRHGNK